MPNQPIIVRDLWGTDDDEMTRYRTEEGARASLPEGYRDYRYAGVWKLDGVDERGCHVFTTLDDDQVRNTHGFLKLTEDQVAAQLSGDDDPEHQQELRDAAHVGDDPEQGEG